jgi:hypothetical protein
MSLLNMKSCRCAKLRLMSFRLDLVCVERLCRSWPFSAAKEPSHIKQSHSSIKRHHRVVPVRRYKIQSRSHRQHTLFTHPIRPFDQTTIAPTSTFTIANTPPRPLHIRSSYHHLSFPSHHVFSHTKPQSPCLTQQQYHAPQPPPQTRHPPTTASKCSPASKTSCRAPNRAIPV